MRLQLERAQTWSNKCVKLDSRNSDKNGFLPGNELAGPPLCWSSGCGGHPVCRERKTAHAVLTSDDSTKGAALHQQPFIVKVSHQMRLTDDLFLILTLICP